MPAYGSFQAADPVTLAPHRLRLGPEKPQMASSKRVVIIGAGIVGVNLADELSSRGWSNITVVEQGPLNMPGGSTSHAPGLVFQTNSSKTMTRLASYTVAKLKTINCFNQVGGLEIATTPERLEEIKRKHGWASSWGIHARLIGAEECIRLYPYLNRARVLGGLHIPDDGLALAARAVQVLIDRTRKAGVTYLEKTPVTAITQHDAKVTGVQTPTGVLPADIVCCAAGFWGVEVGAMVGFRIPLLPLAHQYVKTTSVPDLAKKSPQPNWASLPILRHQDADLYYREHGDQYGIGYYGHKPMPVVASSLGLTPQTVDEKNMPSRLRFTPEDFAPAWKESQDLLPTLKDTEIADGFNGIFSFTPDGGPIMGEHPSLDGMWFAEAVWVTHSAGVARALAQILTTGKSEIDVSECELTRFEEAQYADAYVHETSAQNFVEVYDIIHPLAQKNSPRNLRVSPFFTRQRELGAFFVEQRAWERPQWYESNSHLVEELPTHWRPKPRDAWSAKYWSDITAAESWRTRTAVGLFDMTPLRRLIISGPGAVNLLQTMSTGDMSKSPGNVTWALMLDGHGGIRTDIIAARLDEDTFQVTIFSAVEQARLQREASRQRLARPEQWVDVRDITGGTCALGLWGPRALDVIQLISTNDFSPGGFGYHKVRRIHISGIPVTAISLSHVGEPGWELYCSAEHGQNLWDAIYRAGQPYGLVAAGRGALNALRMEVGYRDFGSDFTTEHNPFEVGLGKLIDSKNHDYIGRTAIRQISQKQPTRRLRGLVVNDGQTMIMGKEPVFHKGTATGYVTSAAFGHAVGRPIAYAILPAGIRDGEIVDIEYFGNRVQATVTPEPLLSNLTTRQQPSRQAARVDRVQARL